MKRVAIYTRVSTDDQTTLNQDVALEKPAKLNEWKIVKTYSDHATSGRIAPHKRPGMRQLLEDVRKGKIDTVAVYELSRLGRITVDVLMLVEELARHNVDLYIHTLSLDTSSAFGRAALTVLLAFAQLEVENNIQRIHAGIERARIHGTKSGKPIGRARLDDPATIDQVQQLRQQGKGINKIAQQLGIGSSTVRRILKEAS